jgi:ribosomal protein L11
MAISKESMQFYQQTLEVTRKQIGDLNTQIEEELAHVKERLAELQASKNAAKQIYDGSCRILGVENDLEKEEEQAAE